MTVVTGAGDVAIAPAATAHDTVLVLDFGSQYSQLIARRVREAKVYCELLPGTVSAEEVRRRKPRGLVFSGGPASVYEPDAPRYHLFGCWQHRDGHKWCSYRREASRAHVES